MNLQAVTQILDFADAPGLMCFVSHLQDLLVEAYGQAPNTSRKDKLAHIQGQAEKNGQTCALRLLGWSLKTKRFSLPKFSSTPRRGGA